MGGYTDIEIAHCIRPQPWLESINVISSLSVAQHWWSFPLIQVKMTSCHHINPAHQPPTSQDCDRLDQNILMKAMLSRGYYGDYMWFAMISHGELSDLVCRPWRQKPIRHQYEAKCFLQIAAVVTRVIIIINDACRALFIYRRNSQSSSHWVQPFK